LTDQERLLPLANIQKIMQDTLGFKRSHHVGKHYNSSVSIAKNDASELLWPHEDGDSECRLAGSKSLGTATYAANN